MKFCSCQWFVAGAVIALGVFQLSAAIGDVTPASPFTDHMVLQQGVAVPVWGTADAGENVSVSVAGKSVSVTADAEGKSMVRLPGLRAGGPFVMTIAGHNTRALQDVLVGEVWVCSGQSNMDFTVARTPKYYFAGANNEAQEVAAANYPRIRMFSGQWSRRYEPQDRVEGEWKICNPANVREFSAIGYFFARDLQKELNVPVGIITETFGASTAEAWISREALVAAPELKPMLDAFDVAAKAYPPEKRKADQEAMAAWQKQMANVTDLARAPKGPKISDPVNNQHNPTVLYNGMIAPIIPYAMKGVLWYQGESILNGARGTRLYPLVQATLIQDWRARWGEGDFPFYIVQLAAYKAAATEPSNSGIASVREAQQTVLKLPNTGMALTIDIGDAKSVHPRDKQDVGERLMKIALANVYGRKIEFSGPVYDSMKIEGNAIRIHFTHVGGGLVAKGGELKQFAIAGKDGKFMWGDAKIDGDSVVVSSRAISDPANVRYAWADNPAGCNLYNADGLPAGPFRTDGNLK